MYTEGHNLCKHKKHILLIRHKEQHSGGVEIQEYKNIGIYEHHGDIV